MTTASKYGPFKSQPSTGPGADRHGKGKQSPFGLLLAHEMDGTAAAGWVMESGSFLESCWPGGGGKRSRTSSPCAHHAQIVGAATKDAEEGLLTLQSALARFCRAHCPPELSKFLNG